MPLLQISTVETPTSGLLDGSSEMSLEEGETHTTLNHQRNR